MRAKVEAEKSASVVQSRIHMLETEDSKIQKKIDQTRRLAEKIASAKELQEEKFERIMKIDYMREKGKVERVKKV